MAIFQKVCLARSVTQPKKILSKATLKHLGNYNGEQIDTLITYLLKFTIMSFANISTSNFLLFRSNSLELIRAVPSAWLFKIGLISFEKKNNLKL